MSDLDTNWNWDRPIAAPGRMHVDFEERVDFQRLHRYRVARARQALESSDLGSPSSPIDDELFQLLPPPPDLPAKIRTRDGGVADASLPHHFLEREPPLRDYRTRGGEVDERDGYILDDDDEPNTPLTVEISVICNHLSSPFEYTNNPGSVLPPGSVCPP